VTALGLAAARAVETSRPDRLIEDPLARPLFDAAGTELPMLVEWPGPDIRPTPEQALHLHGSRYIGLRTRFYDDLLLEAAEAGVDQAVLLGAGLDTRSHRLSLPARLRMFELDQAALLDWKAEVLSRVGAAARCTLVAVGVDLRQDWPAALKAAGHDSTRPTAFVAEGLLAYLTPEEQRSFLRRVNVLAAPGSRLGFDRIAGDPQSGERLNELSRRSGINMSELIAGGEADDLGAVLRGAGWVVLEATAVEVAARYGRDLSDPFAPDEGPAGAEPPWLDTIFVSGSRP
jgi:methyltransferase (TIGR00027 family)